MISRLLFLYMCICLCICTHVFGLSVSPRCRCPSGPPVGSGLPVDPYQICTTQHWTYLSNTANSGLSYLLCSSLDFNWLTPTQVGTHAKPFTGTLNGNYKTLSRYKSALFGMTQGASVYNLVFRNVSLGSPPRASPQINGLVDYAYNTTFWGLSHESTMYDVNDGTSGSFGTLDNCTIRDSVFKSSIGVEHGNDGLAGLAGQISNTILQNVRFTSAISFVGDPKGFDNSISVIAGVGKYISASRFTDCSVTLNVVLPSLVSYPGTPSSWFYPNYISGLAAAMYGSTVNGLIVDGIMTLGGLPVSIDVGVSSPAVATIVPYIDGATSIQYTSFVNL